jgi:hypothetical protein
MLADTRPEVYRSFINTCFLSTNSSISTTPKSVDRPTDKLWVSSKTTSRVLWVDFIWKEYSSSECNTLGSLWVRLPNAPYIVCESVWRRSNWLGTWRESFRGHERINIVYGAIADLNSKSSCEGSRDVTLYFMKKSRSFVHAWQICFTFAYFYVFLIFFHTSLWLNDRGFKRLQHDIEVKYFHNSGSFQLSW